MKTSGETHENQRMWSSSTLRFWAMNVHAIGAWRLLVKAMVAMEKGKPRKPEHISSTGGSVFMVIAICTSSWISHMK